MPVHVAFTVAGDGVAALRATPRSYVPARMVVTLDGERHPALEVGLALKGNAAGSFRDLEHKAAFKVKVDEVVEDQRFLGLRGFKLNNMEEDSSQIHEVLGYGLFEALDIPAARAGHATVTFNGEAFGLYALVERIDEVWAGRHFAGTRHIYEAPAPGVDLTPEFTSSFEVDAGDTDDRSDLDELSTIATVDDEAFFRSLADHTDEDALVRQWALSQYIAHWDGYAGATNNYYLHVDGDGRLSMVPSGLDQALEADWYDVRHGASPYSVRGRLFERCLDDTGCAESYEAALRDVATHMESLDVVGRIEALVAHITDAVENDPRREASLENVHAAQQVVRSFVQGRTSSLRP